jgi:DNA mismatch endonuclease (patch repair protein)
MRETSEQTSRKMSRIRASGSLIEKALGRALWQARLRYRRQYRVPGTPDIALVSLRIAVFCDNDFWHGYRCGDRFRSTFRIKGWHGNPPVRTSCGGTDSR